MQSHCADKLRMNTEFGKAYQTNAKWGSLLKRSHVRLRSYGNMRFCRCYRFNETFCVSTAPGCPSSPPCICVWKIQKCCTEVSDRTCSFQAFCFLNSVHLTVSCWYSTLPGSLVIIVFLARAEAARLQIVRALCNQGLYTLPGQRSQTPLRKVVRVSVMWNIFNNLLIFIF